MKKIPSILISILFTLILMLGSILLLILPKETYSEAERRPLSTPPSVSLDTLLDGRFFSELDTYMADHFPGREFFRMMKAVWQKDVLKEWENNGYVLFEGSIIKLEKQVNTASLAYAGERFQAVYEQYLKNSDCRLYAAVIPDKSFFLSAEGFPVMDFSDMENRFADSIPGAEYISLKDSLTLEDYYRTDSHWRQDRLLPAAETLLLAMGAAAPEEESAFQIETYAPFTGVYAKQAAFPYEPESIQYLTGTYLDQLEVRDYDTSTVIPVYDPENCDPRDAYTLFLGGAKAFLRLENPNAKTDRNLVVFRDSFGSSIAPLLAGSYRSVTLIDLRYISRDFIRRYMRFTNQDVLFLYSATLLNNSQGLIE
ncbi:MAG: hypothetical protein IJ773_12570 [Lachnospiraceae bacterium]|nr:hypothetical protein [Lachnospiraceae bacterium]